MKKYQFINFYKGLALILFNTLVLLIIVNLIFFLGILFLKERITVGPLTFEPDVLKVIYPNHSPEEIKGILGETYKQHLDLGKITRGYEYESFTGFKEVPRKGKYVNIDPNGYRYIENQCDYPISNKTFNIFVFGGSTTFGVGLPDSETIPSRIQTQLRQKLNRTDICVYNFGRSFYYSSQERVFFQEQILKGQKPNISIFIDGLNEPEVGPQNERILQNFMQGKHKISLFFSDVSIIRISNYISDKYFRKVAPMYLEDDLKKILNRYLDNKKIVTSIGNSYGIQTYFVIQPIPNYNYNLSYNILFTKHLLSYDDNADLVLRKQFYYAFNDYYQNLSTPQKNQYIWLADLQKDEKNNLYVDYAHYTANFSNKIAESISERIKIKN